MNRMIGFILACAALVVALGPAPVAVAQECSLEAAAFARFLSDGGDSVCRVLYKFDIPVELSNARVDKAILEISLTDADPGTVEGLRVYAAAEGWQSSQTPQAFAEVPVHDSLSVCRLHPNEDSGMWELDVTDLFSAWCSGQFENNGMVIERLFGGQTALDVTSSDAMPEIDKPSVRLWVSRMQ